MKNLFERLSEENRQKIIHSNYYVGSKMCISDLENKTSWYDLKFGTVIFLCQEIYGDNDTTIIKIDKLFR